MSDLALSLLQVAALHGVPEAHVALFYRHQQGLGGATHDSETAAFYGLWATDKSSEV